MLLDLLETLESWDIVLGSGSPRRLEIVTDMGLNVRVVTSSFAEDLDKTTFATPEEYVAATALAKGKDVASQTPQADLVIAADSVVIRDSTILEKPSSEEDAREKLRSLSGREHYVHTAVVLGSPSSAQGEEDEIEWTTFGVSTWVVFDELSDELIDAYVATGSPMDKAGGYGIQDLAGMFVKEIRGDYFNVMGLPKHALACAVANLVRAK